jgi:hypothetical protein
MPYGLMVKIRKAPGCTIATPAGELHIATAPQLRECLLPDHPTLVIDLNQVSFCDATGPLGRPPSARDRPMPGREELPSTLRRSPEKAQETWIKDT